MRVREVRVREVRVRGVRVLTLRRGLQGAGDDAALSAVELEGEAGVRPLVEVLVRKFIVESVDFGAADSEQRLGA